jgi:hypothetical protein
MVEAGRESPRGPRQMSIHDDDAWVAGYEALHSALR